MSIQSHLATIVLAFADEVEEAEVPNPVIPELKEVLWAAGSFFVLWALMRYVLLPPILERRAARQEQVRADREAADRARAGLGQVQADYDASLADARAEADRIIDEARGEAAEHRAELLGEANTEIGAMRSEAAGGLSESRGEAISALRDDVGDIAVSAASAVLGKSVDRQRAQSAIDAAIDGGDS